MTVVETTAGRVSGQTIEGIAAYKGIPYGADTSDEGRFRAPRPVDPWNGVRDASSYGPAAAQIGSLGSRRDIFGLRPIGESMSEDCLVLNVWAPEHASQLPVLFWIHGGGFNSGSGSSPVFDGSALAWLGDMVVVTINHRLGIFGHLYLDDVDERFAGSANVALFDIVAALRWVRENIAAFGGDANRVAICGESSGAGKVGALMSMPQATGLFSGAILQSGAPATIIDPHDASLATAKVFDRLGLGPHESDKILRTPVEELLDVQREIERGAGPGNRFGPVFDNLALSPDAEGSTAAHVVSRVPLIIGTNLDEARYLILRARAFRDPTLIIEEDDLRQRLGRLAGDHAAALLETYRNVYPGATTTELLFAAVSGQTRRRAGEFADRLVADGLAPVYMYLFSWPTSLLDGVLRSCHALEIAFMFNNVEQASAAHTGDSPQMVATPMSRSWAEFTRTGAPGRHGTDAWEPYTLELRSTMVFDAESHIEHDPLAPCREIWATMPLHAIRRNWSVIL